MSIRKICVVVTARPSYSRIKTALLAIDQHPQLELQLVVTASALLGRYGNAINVIEKDGFKIASKVLTVLEGGSLGAQAKTTGLGIIELTNVFETLKPDAVVTVADRFETMSTAIAASYLNIPLVHIQGGEVTGNIDEKVRHAITKLADLHFVSSAKAKERVLKMGEREETVHLTGCPSIDIAVSILKDDVIDFDIYKRYGGVGTKPRLEDGYLVVMQHPVTTEYDLAKVHIQNTIKAVDELEIPTLWFWPNVDAGSDGTSNGIRSYRENTQNSHIHFFKNMEPVDFLKVLKNSKCLIGNSSVGIRESSYLGIPVVNIGTRQSGRERGGNVLDVDYGFEAIKKGINQQVKHGQFASQEIYGHGNAGKKIAQLLASLPLTFNKKLTY